MSENLEIIRLKQQLAQSETYGQTYIDLLDDEGLSTFSSPLFGDLYELLQNILSVYENLTGFQKQMLNAVFNAFNNLRKEIDPDRLKSFEHYFNQDNELLLFRSTERGIVNIIFNPEDCIAYSFISKEHGGDVLKFYYSDQDDFEGLAYNFFSY